MTTPDPATTAHIPAAPLHSPGEHVAHATTADGVTTEAPASPAVAPTPAAPGMTTASSATTVVATAHVPTAAEIASQAAMKAAMQAHALATQAAAAAAVAPKAAIAPAVHPPLTRPGPVAPAVAGIKVVPKIARPVTPPVKGAPIVPVAKPAVTPVSSNTVTNMAQRHAALRPMPNPTQQLITNLQRVQVAGWSLSTQAVATKASLTALVMTCTVSKPGETSITSNQILYQPGPTAQAAWEALALSILVKVPA